MQFAFQLLTDVSMEVESLKIEPSSWLRVFDVAGPRPGLKPHVVVPGMRQLNHLHLDVSRVEDSFKAVAATLEGLPALTHLTSLRLEWRHSLQTEVIQHICSTLALSRLDLAGCDVLHEMEKSIDFQRVLYCLTFGKTSGLRELALPCRGAEAQQLGWLTALTALTAFSVLFSDPSAQLHGLVALTRLRRLCVDSRAAGGEAIVDSLAPLSALTGLTLLDLDGDKIGAGCGKEDRTGPLDVSVLSSLTALRVLRCSSLCKAEFAAGDLLPVQFRFLRSATALEELDLGFQASFWSLPDHSITKTQQAVSALSCLKKVVIRIGGRKARQSYYAPLSAFAAASSIETIFYRASCPSSYFTRSVTPAKARDCFKALGELRSLTIGGNRLGTAKVPHCAELLAGIPSTHLTCLCLGVSKADVPLMQQITRFRGLQELMLHSNPVHPESLGPLFNLKCLTHLVLTVHTSRSRARRLQLAGWPMGMPYPSDWCRDEHLSTSAGTTISVQAARLMMAIHDRARLVGVAAFVDMRASHKDY